MKILAFNRFYLPGYKAGGPIRTLANMVDRLGSDFDFYIITTDRDLGDTSPYSNIENGVWQSVGKARVVYIESGCVDFGRIIDLIADAQPDVIYLNGFFDYIFTQRVLWARWLGRLKKIPVVLAPRGEFSQGALRLKSFKKKVYLQFVRIFHVYHGLVWQASSENERADILKNLRFVRESEVKLAMNLAPIDEGEAVGIVDRTPDQPLRLCFLSRISPMKNLDFALRVLQRVSSDVVFTIYGPKEDRAYWIRCEDLIAKLPKNVKVVYVGEIHPSEVNQALQHHHIFFLPTRGENYGHVIHEALGAGLPVLISDQTPWSGVMDRGVGWAFPLGDEAGFAEVIDEVASWEASHMRDVRHAAIDFARERSIKADVIKANYDLFSSTIK